MFGKGAIIFVMGISMVFSVYQSNLDRSVIEATGNFNTNYMTMLAHESAMSAMNYAINDVWDDETDSVSYQIIQDPCTTQVDIRPKGLDTVEVKAHSRLYIFDEEEYQASGNQLMIHDSIYAYFTYNTSLSKYFWFTNSDNGVYWITGDTVWGPMHCNYVVETNGSPVFYGKVTARRGISPNPMSWRSHAKFYGGWEIGINTAVPTDMSHLLTAATVSNNGAAMNTMCMYDEPLSLEFLSDGSAIRTVDGVTDTVMIDSIATAGVIHCTEDVHVKGTLNGALSIYSADDIWIDDNIEYVNDPVTNPSVDDILGLIANDDIIVTDNAANNSDLTIHASMLAVNGSFGAENHDSRPVSGILRVVGSIAQDRRGPVGTFSWWSGMINHGFSKRYYYDPRFASLSSPYFPYVRALHLVSWWE
ncbi:hypothetical protein K8I28_04660 [bacterium]|nr:hypothetical protein [bacterium]